MFFLLFLLDDRRIRIQEAQKHVDPDPEHWLETVLRIRMFISDPGGFRIFSIPDPHQRIQVFF